MHSTFTCRKLDTWYVQKEMNKFIEEKYNEVLPVAQAHTVKISINLLCQMCYFNYSDIKLEKEMEDAIETYKRCFLKCEFIDIKYKLFFFIYRMICAIYKERARSSRMYRVVSSIVSKRLIER